LKKVVLSIVTSGEVTVFLLVLFTVFCENIIM